MCTTQPFLLGKVAATSRLPPCQPQVPQRDSLLGHPFPGASYGQGKAAPHSAAALGAPKPGNHGHLARCRLHASSGRSRRRGEGRSLFPPPPTQERWKPGAVKKPTWRHTADEARCPLMTQAPCRGLCNILTLSPGRSPRAGGDSITPHQGKRGREAQWLVQGQPAAKCRSPNPSWELNPSSPGCENIQRTALQSTRRGSPGLRSPQEKRLVHHRILSTCHGAWHSAPASTIRQIGPRISSLRLSPGTQPSCFPPT